MKKKTRVAFEVLHNEDGELITTSRTQLFNLCKRGQTIVEAGRAYVIIDASSTTTATGMQINEYTVRHIDAPAGGLPVWWPLDDDSNSEQPGIERQP